MREAWTRERSDALKASLRQHGLDVLRTAAATGYTPNQITSALSRAGTSLRQMRAEALTATAPPPGGVVIPGPQRKEEPCPRASGSEQAANEAPEALDWRGSRPQTPPTGVERRLNIGDLHIPAHSASALACVYALIRALQPHKIFQLGDLLNAQAFSRHGVSSPKAERIDQATLAARGFVRAVKAASPGSDLVIVKGNHDGWAERWEAENPAFEGSFDFETMLGLKNLPDDDRPPMFEGVRVVRHPEESGYVDGPIAYCHGTGGGMYAARRYAENIGPRAGVRHIRFAHHHTDQIFCHKNGIKARCVGWLGNEHHESNAFSYAPQPRGWWVGITVDDVAGEFVSTTDVEIRSGVAFFGGRLISAGRLAA